MPHPVTGATDDSLARIASVISALEDRNLPCQDRASIIFGLWEDRKVNQDELENSILPIIHKLLKTRPETLDSEIFGSLDLSASSTPSDSEKSESSSLIRSIGGESSVIGGQMSSFRSESSLAQSPVASRRPNGPQIIPGSHDPSPYNDSLPVTSYSLVSQASLNQRGVSIQSNLKKADHPSSSSRSKPQSVRETLALELCVLHRLLRSRKIEFAVKLELAQLLQHSPHLQKLPTEVCNLLIIWLSDSNFIDKLQKLSEETRATTHKPTAGQLESSNAIWPAEWEDKLRYTALSSVETFPRLTGKLDYFAFSVVQSTLFPIALQLCVSLRFAMLETAETSAKTEPSNRHEGAFIDGSVSESRSGFSRDGHFNKQQHRYSSSKHFPVLVLCALSVQAAELFIYRLPPSRVCELLVKVSELSSGCVALLSGHTYDSKIADVLNYVKFVLLQLFFIGTNKSYTPLVVASRPIIKFICLLIGSFPETLEQELFRDASIQFWNKICEFGDCNAASALLYHLSQLATVSDNESLAFGAVCFLSRIRNLGFVCPSTLHQLFTRLFEPFLASPTFDEARYKRPDFARLFIVIAQFLERFANNIGLETWQFILTVLAREFAPFFRLLDAQKERKSLQADTNLHMQFPPSALAAADSHFFESFSKDDVFFIANYCLNLCKERFAENKLFEPYQTICLELLPQFPLRLSSVWASEIISVGRAKTVTNVANGQFKSALHHWPNVVKAVCACPEANSLTLQRLFDFLSHSVEMSVIQAEYSKKNADCSADIQRILEQVSVFKLQSADLAVSWTALLATMARAGTLELLDDLLLFANTALSPFLPIDANLIVKNCGASRDLDGTFDGNSDAEGDDESVVSGVVLMPAQSERDSFLLEHDLATMDYLFLLLKKFKGHKHAEMQILARILLFFQLPQPVLQILLGKLFPDQQLCSAITELELDDCIKTNALLFWLSQHLAGLLDSALSTAQFAFPPSFFSILDLLPKIFRYFSNAMRSLRYLKNVFCRVLLSKTLPAAFSAVVSGLDVTSHICNIVAQLASLRHSSRGAIFNKRHTDDIAHALVLCLSGRSVSASKVALQALFLVAFESELSLMKYLQVVLLKLGMLSRAEMAAPILELLLGITYASIPSVSSSNDSTGVITDQRRNSLSPTSNPLNLSSELPLGDKRETILKNLVEQEWRRVFGIAVQYVKSPPILHPGSQLSIDGSHSAVTFTLSTFVEDSVLLKCQCVSNYAVQLAYQTVVCYFNKLKGTERQKYVSFIVSQLSKATLTTGSAFEGDVVADQLPPIGEIDDNVLLVFDILGLLWWDTLIDKQDVDCEFAFDTVRVFDAASLQRAEQLYVESLPSGTEVAWDTRCYVAGYQVLTLKVARLKDMNSVVPASDWMKEVKPDSLCLITTRRPCGIRMTAVYWSTLLAHEVPFVPGALVTHLSKCWEPFTSSPALASVAIGQMRHPRTPSISALARSRSRSEVSVSSRSSADSDKSSTSSLSSSLNSERFGGATMVPPPLQSGSFKMKHSSSESRGLPAESDSQSSSASSLRVVGDKVSFSTKLTNSGRPNSSALAKKKLHRSSKSTGGSVSELAGLRRALSVGETAGRNARDARKENEMDRILNGQVIAELVQVPHLSAANFEACDGENKAFYDANGLVDSSGAAARALSVLDRTPVVDLHKIGIVYMGPGQKSEVEILANRCGSTVYHQFLERIGRYFNLKNAPEGTYTGGLDTSSEAFDGERALAWEDRLSQVIFHVATEMPSRISADPQMLTKKRHIGNNFVLVVWDDSGSVEPFKFDTISGQFNYVNIIIKPVTKSARHARHDYTVSGSDKVALAYLDLSLQNADYQFSSELDDSYFTVSLQCREGMPRDTHPLVQPKLVSGHALCGFVRSIAIQMNMLVHIWQATINGSKITRQPILSEQSQVSTAALLTEPDSLESSYAEISLSMVNGKAIARKKSAMANDSVVAADVSPVKVTVSNSHYISNWMERLLQIKRLSQRSPVRIKV